MAMINELEFIFVSSKSSNATKKCFLICFTFYGKNGTRISVFLYLFQLFEISIQPFKALNKYFTPTLDTM